MAKQFSVSVLLKAIDQITAPTAKMKGALGDLTGKLDAYSKKWGGKKEKGGIFGEVFGGAALGTLAANGISSAIEKVKEFAATGLQLASDLTEVQNVVDTTFGDSANKINRWSKDAMTAFGLTELQAKKFTGTMGAMLKSSGLSGNKITEMSTRLAGLAGDFASFYNLDAAEAFDKIRAGISGETEPLKQLGINMSVANLEAHALTLGIKKKMAAMTQSEQAQLRYLYLLDKSADAQGDFADTLDESYANQKRVADNKWAAASANIMKVVLPLATKFQKTFGDIADKVGEWFQANEAVIGQNIEKFFTLVTGAAQGLWEVLKVLGGVIKTLWDGGFIQAVLAGVVAFKAITFAAWAWETAMVAVKVAQFAAANASVLLGLAMKALPFGWISLAITGVVAAIAFLWANWDNVTKWMADAWAAIGPVVMQVADIIKKSFLSVVAVAFAPFLIGLDAIISGIIAVGKLAGQDMSGLEGFQKQARSFAMENTFAGDVARAVTGPGPAVQTGASANGETKQKTEVVVDFRNMPRGTRVDSTGAQKGLNMNMGYANVGF